MIILYRVTTVGIDFENKETVKKEILSLKNLMAEFRQKIDLHMHEEIGFHLINYYF